MSAQGSGRPEARRAFSQVLGQRAQQLDGARPLGLRRVHVEGPLPQVAPPGLDRLVGAKPGIGQEADQRGVTLGDVCADPFHRQRRQWLRSTRWRLSRLVDRLDGI